MSRDNVVQPLARLGEILLALPMVFFGGMHLTHGPGVANLVPPWIPWRLFWAYFTGAALAAAGVSIISKKLMRPAATLLGVMILLFVLLIHLPSIVQSIVHNPSAGDVLWSFNGTGGVNNALKDVALSMSAFMLGLVGVPQTRSNSPRRPALVPANIFAVVIVLYGIEHFLYTGYTPGIPSWSLVSYWIPWRLFWGYLTGAILLLAGLSILFRKEARAAAAGFGIVILSVAVLAYMFRVIGHQGDVGELMNAAKDVGLAGGAWILARSVPDTREGRT